MYSRRPISGGFHTTTDWLHAWCEGRLVICRNSCRQARDARSLPYISIGSFIHQSALDTAAAAVCSSDVSELHRWEFLPNSRRQPSQIYDSFCRFCFEKKNISSSECTLKQSKNFRSAHAANVCNSNNDKIYSAPSDATSSKRKILIYILSRTIFQLSQSIGLVFDKGCLSLMHTFSAISANIVINHILLKARFLPLHFCRRQCGSIFNHVLWRTCNWPQSYWILCVTDRRTDRQNHLYNSGLWQS